MQRLLRSFTDDQARTYFLTLVLTGVRRAEAQQLRWRDVDNVDMLVRVRKSKTRTGGAVDRNGSRPGGRAGGARNQSSYDGDDERVFCHPLTGGVYKAERFREALEQACKRARVELPDGFRPQHDLRVTSITSDAIAGATPTALKAKAGHANMATTDRYIKLAGVVFRAEAEAQAARLLGGSSTNRLPTHSTQAHPCRPWTAQRAATAPRRRAVSEPALLRLRHSPSLRGRYHAPPCPATASS